MLIKFFTPTLSWLLLILGAAFLFLSGYCFNDCVDEDFSIGHVFKFLTFLLLGVFCLLLYGEKKRSRGFIDGKYLENKIENK